MFHELWWPRFYKLKYFFSQTVFKQKNSNNPSGFSYDAFILHDVKKDELGEALVKNKMARFVDGGLSKLQRFKLGLLNLLNEELDGHMKTSDDDYEDDTQHNFDDYEVNLGNNSEFLQQVFEDLGVPTKRMDEEPSTSKSVSVRPPENGNQSKYTFFCLSYL